jgi:D-tyrosyl-tRNA(Tyr) deacylase
VRAVLQRVSSARVDVEGEPVSQMGEGIVALIGVARADTVDVAAQLAHKIIHLRIFEDAEGRMNRSIVDVGGTLCVVSQFTLFADARKGRRPSYGEAAPAAEAEPLVAHLAACAEGHGVAVVTGRFQTLMDVSLVNHGPVTILLDTDRRF